jgi:low affinity Fe/Cu permease
LSFFVSNIIELNGKLDELLISACEYAHVGLDSLLDLNIQSFIKKYEVMVERSEKQKEDMERSSKR